MRGKYIPGKRGGHEGEIYPWKKTSPSIKWWMDMTKMYRPAGVEPNLNSSAWVSPHRY